jgi:hypothetical protein
MADELSNEIVYLCDEAGLLPGKDAMLKAGLSPQQVVDAAATILNADDPKQAISEIGEQVSEELRKADLQEFITELPAAGREAEIRAVAQAYGIPVERARACIEIAEAHDDLVERLRGFRDSVRKVIVRE